MLQHHRSPNLVPPMQTDTNMLIKVHTQINCVLMQGKSQMTWISPLPRPFYQSPNLIYTTHTHVKKCPWYHIVLRQKAVIGRQALWSHPRWVFIAKVKDRCCVWWLASGWRLMVSLICRIISEKRVRRCRFGAYYCVCVCVYACSIGVGLWVCVHKSMFVWVATPVLEPSHLLIRNYEHEVSSIYWNIRCCGLVNIWISDGIVAVHSVLPDSAQLDFVRSVQGVVHNHNDWKGLRCYAAL